MMMIRARTSILSLLFASSAVVQGFAPMMPSARSPVRLSASLDEDLPMDIPEPTNKNSPSSFAFDFVEDEEILEEPIVTTSKATTPSIKTPKIDVDMDGLKEKASTAFEDISSKAKDFVEDERVQEIAEKAKDFAQDVAGKVFGAVGDKLKELKKEREEMKNSQE